MRVGSLGSRFVSRGEIAKFSTGVHMLTASAKWRETETMSEGSSTGREKRLGGYEIRERERERGRGEGKKKKANMGV